VLETIGYDAAVAASFAPWRAADASVGRVVRLDRGVATVLTEKGTDRVTLGGALLSEIAEHPDRTPCAGDWVVVRSWPDGPHTLERVLPRRSVVPGDAGPGKFPVLAANVDAVVHLPDAASDPLVHRLAADVEVIRAEPVPGSTAGLEAVRALLHARRTVALVGPKGDVAMMLERLVGTTALAGRQSGAELVVVPGGGVVVDLTAVAGAPTEEGPRAARPVS
jgi:ribosome biogenesis GTPase